MSIGRCRSCEEELASKYPCHCGGVWPCDPTWRFRAGGGYQSNSDKTLRWCHECAGEHNCRPTRTEVGPRLWAGCMSFYYPTPAPTPAPPPPAPAPTPPPPAQAPTPPAHQEPVPGPALQHCWSDMTEESDAELPAVLHGVTINPAKADSPHSSTVNGSECNRPDEPELPPTPSTKTRTIGHGAQGGSLNGLIFPSNDENKEGIILKPLQLLMPPETPSSSTSSTWISVRYEIEREYEGMGPFQ